jgi:hypothetical protein
MSRQPRTKKKKQHKLPRWDECPYPELHEGTYLPRLTMGGTGEWDVENGQPPKVVMRCMMGNEWIPVLSDGHVYPVRTTGEDTPPSEQG